jgi:hypothetical protein
MSIVKWQREQHLSSSCLTVRANWETSAALLLVADVIGS